tara:strand:- start:3110 stop:3328 length:219 start_codon:yes stop_codon:yes gene_type:complete
MKAEHQIILFIFSSILGYLARMKIKSNCCGCSCEIERNDNNKMESIKVIRKSISKSSNNLDEKKTKINVGEL